MGRYGADAQCSGIYKIENTANHKIYVGQSKNVFIRRKQHFSALRAGEHENDLMQADWNRNGGRTFRWEVIEYCSLDKLNEREKYRIEQLDTLEPRGYNKGWSPYKRKAVKPKKQMIKKYRRTR